MSLKDLKIEISYETTYNKTDLLDNFYIPVLSESVNYYRIAGFFNSTSLSVALKGIEALILNGGKVYLLISPEISDDDYDVIIKNSKDKKEYLFKDFNISDFKNNEHLQLLSWMLANDKIEIKIVVDKNSRHSIFHQKVGIFEDSLGNMLSFSGSVNETASAWLENIEEFKTFSSWEPGQQQYLLSDLKKFSSYWNNEKGELAEVYELPEAIIKQIIEVSPHDVHDISLMKKYTQSVDGKQIKLKLFNHQEEAVKTWVDNNFQLLMEMATGTGKTRTAIGCMVKFLNEEKNFLTIVATPQGTLSRQWKKDIETLNIHFDYSKIIDGTNPNWKEDLEIFLLDHISGIYNNGIIYTTHKTSSANDFLSIINKYLNNLSILFVCDEVHGIGSNKQKMALLNEYKYRIGLSATPERLYDEYGSTLIRDYFGKKSFEFTIHDALHTINPYTHEPFLNSFKYVPLFVSLTDTEIKKYRAINRKIAIFRSKEDYDEDELNKLYERRADIVKNASMKMGALEKIIDSLERKDKIKDTILFVSEKQRDDAISYLSRKGIVREKITEEESASKKVTDDGKTEREEIISRFKTGDCQVLIGLKCLDEGIDIPNARIAILMSSSTNPREYIQRVGRVIRQAKGKSTSIIYDIIVDASDYESSAESILFRESKRTAIIAKDAINYNEVYESFRKRGIDLNAY